MTPLADRYDAFLLDLDGVLYRGDDPVPSAAEAVAALRERGRGLTFVTNNFSRTPAQVATLLHPVGVPARAEEVVTSALATAALLATRGVRRTFVIGELGIREALEGRGIGRRRGRGMGPSRRLREAPDGRWPGAGALVAAVETTTGRPAEVVGKPKPPIFTEALRRAGGGRPLVIGDRLDTDIAGANRAGWDSLLVLTGITGPDELGGAKERPTHVAPDLSILLADDGAG